MYEHLEYHLLKKENPGKMNGMNKIESPNPVDEIKKQLTNGILHELSPNDAIDVIRISVVEMRERYNERLMNVEKDLLRLREQYQSFEKIVSSLNGDFIKSESHQ